MPQLYRIAKEMRLAYGVACLLVLVPAPAVAQQFGDVAAGWTSVGPLPTDEGTTYRNGASLRLATGVAVSPRLRLAVDGMAIFFERSQERAVPCPSNGCPHPYYDTQAAAQISVGGSGQLDVDSRGRFFLDAGAGEYATFLGMTQFRLGISGGAGITIPIGPRLLSVVQADWHTLLGQTSGPRNFFPITVGLRF